MPVRLIKEVGMIELPEHEYDTVTLAGHGVDNGLLAVGADVSKPEHAESLEHADPLTDNVIARPEMLAAEVIVLTVSVYGVESRRLMENSRAPVAAAFVTKM
jgi:hypothetical protein